MIMEVQLSILLGQPLLTLIINSKKASLGLRYLEMNSLFE
jgi:hypothetical protein